MRRPFAISAVVGLLLAAVATNAAADAAGPPRRVVSMNVCTDQLAMLLAAPGQLISVSYLAGDPATSALAERAAAYRVNHGLAEEIFLLRPDLVLAGTFTTRATVELLRRLGFRVEEFAPEESFEGIRANISRMGELLGRSERAAELVAELDAGLEELEAMPGEKKTIALYFANSFTSGAGTLVDAVVRAAGLRNLAEDFGIVGTVRLPLELLVLARPDLIAAGDRRHIGPARAQENTSHPTFAALADRARLVVLESRYTVCGAPFTLDAARRLQEAARQ